MQKMTLTRALAEVSTLDSRIRSVIGDTLFVSTKRGLTKETPSERKFKDVKEVEARITSTIQSANDLIARRAAIKAEIGKANVRTSVNIAGKTMTIAEALDYRKTIEYKSLMLNNARSQLNVASNAIQRNQIEMDQQINAAIQQILGKDAGTDRNAVERAQELVKTTSDSIKDQHSISMIDPIDVKQYIDDLSKEINDALNEIDFCLSEVNAQTTIEV